MTIAASVSEASGPSRQQELLTSAKAHLLANYKQPPLALTRGQGCRVWDVAGREYLDLCAGIAVLIAGHSHPTLVSAIADQAGRLMHTSNLFYTDRGAEFAEALTRRTGYPRAFFCNSGTEALEALLKLARRFHYENGAPERTKLISTINGFHGRTMGALSLTGQPKYHDGLRPLVGDVEQVAYGDLDAMRAVIDERTAAVIIEPIQAEGGIIVASDEYLLGLQKLCHERGALLMFDEVQTGYGRTGRFLAREWSGVQPDAVALAKGIGGGFPLGAMVLSERLSGGLPPGSHGTTFGGNPLACAAGLAVLRIVDEEHLVERAEKLGAFAAARLRGMCEDPLVKAHVVDVRGRGLLLGVMLADHVDPLATLAKVRDAGLLLSIAGGRVLRMTPPLVVTESELEEGIELLTRVLRDPPRVAFKAA